MGYTAGYLSEQEAWRVIMSVAQTLQRAFKSWDQMGEDYLAGRAMWVGLMKQNAQNPIFDPGRYQAIYELLINKNDQNSPWTRIPWDTPLNGQTAPLSPEIP